MDNFLDSPPCGIFVFNDGGVILSANEPLCTWLGYAVEELNGKNIESILTIASRIFYNTHFFPLIKLHGKADEIFLNLLGKEKNDIPVLSNSVRQNRNGIFVNMTVVIPVFQRRRYEDEILQARNIAENTLKENKTLEELTKKLEARTQELDKQFQKMVSINHDLLQFSKIISHDLQEPIHKIKVFTNLLSNEKSELSPDRRTDTLSKIHLAADRLKSLTHGLQQYVAVDSEKTYSDVNLTEVIGIARSKVAEHRNFSNFSLEFDHLPVIEGYRNQLELLFFHLLDNSIQFRHPHRKLMITINAVSVDENVYRATQDRYKFTEHLKIVFADNGIGFENEYKDYAFGLVKKINAGSEGLGIGLSLVKKIIHNHSGAIQVQSEPEKGTRFSFVLPVKVE
jgi:sigma-B regulation protein RsbU (phosphoserine phosphatase)